MCAAPARTVSVVLRTLVAGRPTTVLSDKSVLVSVTQQWLHRCKGDAASVYIYYGNLGYQNSVTPKMTDKNLAYTVVNYTDNYMLHANLIRIGSLGLVGSVV